ncbi:hypothetical protein GWI33_007265 [Rhynchophorus ferrugineus]|uniref:Uncharacterized protein n=1 Tax=Rhynchophorus ferrugineus TaxID=354439 RepID=A0A834IG80_RHYFE|nr:hypothetical protein GWI33_007265 [Rhynchophorus ferrugineus]
MSTILLIKTSDVLRAALPLAKSAEIAEKEPTRAEKKHTPIPDAITLSLSLPPLFSLRGANEEGRARPTPAPDSPTTLN